MMTLKDAETLLQGKLSRYFGVTFAEATEEQLQKAVAMSVRDILLEKRMALDFHKCRNQTSPKLA